MLSKTSTYNIHVYILFRFYSQHLQVCIMPLGWVFYTSPDYDQLYDGRKPGASHDRQQVAEPKSHHGLDLNSE